MYVYLIHTLSSVTNSLLNTQMLPHISFSLENFGEFVFLGEQGRFPLLFRVSNVVKEIVIFY